MSTISQIKKRGKEFVRGRSFPIAFNLVFLALIVELVMSMMVNGSGRMNWIRGVAAGDIVASVGEIRSLLLALLGMQLVIDIVLGVFMIGAGWAFVQWRVTNTPPKNQYRASLRFWRKDVVMDSVVLIAVRLFFLTLWTMLLVVPGIIKQYSYSQATFLYAEDVAAGRQIKSAGAYLKASAQLMRGHKMELFALQLSFIGWFILDLLTMKMSSLYSRPYYTAATAEFFLALRVQKQVNDDKQ
ncbi:DUF975 family protein [Weissella ceti]|uniref:DUF975 family protein n=1 Tax=Weissella ceti TaxID=759620 RepID=A0ABT3E4S8_9LACO|nr:DUF975 family protein [Weissella ceti]MCW0953420.1 DUF975 family protein [Weissella ceti]QVK12023.1 DUF975 family protein [Weissella ceti]